MPMINKINISLENSSHPIYIGKNILSTANLIKQHLTSNQAMIITDKTVSKYYHDLIVHISSQIEQCDILVLPDGENTKNINTVIHIAEELIKKKHTRTTTLIALGGGVIGDTTGFTASCYQRGVNFIQIPTTLLAQADSSIGGKTGVNLHEGKNMLGTFHQPSAILIDTHFLDTISDRCFSSGLSEIFKYGLMYDAMFFHKLKQNISLILDKDERTLTDIIFKSCKIKAHFIEQDEKEKTGLRSLLNYGHTFGHAIETALNYNGILHGEAISIGMTLAAKFSQIPKHQLDEIVNLFKCANLPTKIPETLQAEQLINIMSTDKKNQNGNEISLILLNKIGEAYIHKEKQTEKLLQFLQCETNNNIPLLI